MEAVFFMASTLEARQRQTANARAAFVERFPTEQDKSAHFRELAKRSHASRVVLSGDDAESLRSAYALLQRIFEREAA
jgi:hypothetical protein